ncbi:MAG: polysaccharide biosynthesis/export family protein [Aestuariivirga sp.]
MISNLLRAAAAVALSAAMLAGCTGIPRSGPAEKAFNEKQADLAGFTLINMDASTIGNYLVLKKGDGAGTGGVPAAPAVRLSSGDLLRVKISESKDGGLFAPLASGGTSFDNVRVDHKGTISLPYAGRVKVAGLDPQKVEDRIRSRLSSVAFEPQVYVELVADRGSSVLVGGEVKAPGRFSLMEGPLTLLDAIARAGGPNLPQHQIDVVIRRGNSVKRIPLSTLQSGNNRQLRAGDEVVLEANTKVFNALGAVTKTGQVEFSKLNPSLLDALSQVGGLSNELASNTGVFVFRMREPRAWKDESGNWHEGPAIFRFDMSKPETMFIAQAFGVKPDDTIYVTNAPTVEWERALRPIATTIATVNGTVNFGVSTVNRLN